MLLSALKQGIALCSRLHVLDQEGDNAAGLCAALVSRHCFDYDLDEFLCVDLQELIRLMRCLEPEDLGNCRVAMHFSANSLERGRRE